MTFSDLIDEYTAHLRALNRAATTIKVRSAHLRRFLDHASDCGVDHPSRVTTSLIHAYQRLLSRSVNARGDLNSPELCNRHLAALKGFFRYLRREDRMAHDPAVEIEYARQPKRLPKAILTARQVRRILRQPDTSTVLGYRDRTILEVLYSTAVRRRELIRLTVEDVNLEAGLLTVRQGKGMKDRVVPLGRIACRYIETYLNGIRPELVGSDPGNRALFLSRIGRQMDPSTIKHLVAKHARAAGIKVRVTPHTFRHSCATHMIRNRAGIRHVQELLGHSQLTTTQQYVRVSKGQVAYIEDAATNRTSYAYDAATGRRTAVTNALDEVTSYHYSIEGQLLGTWGNVYPVAYEYDDHDRMSAMYTYRGTTNITSYSVLCDLFPSMDKTQWLYDEATGLLTNKLYADGKGTAYSYTSDGKLSTRTWARGATTTYSYAPCCGALTNINYSGTTPDIAFTYDRLGRQSTVTDAQGTRTFAYDPVTLQLTNETIVTGGTTNVLARNYDSQGRASGLLLNPVDPVYHVQYSYSDLGRFGSITSVVQDVTHSWQYGYLASSDLIAAIQHPSYASYRSYEPNRNLITSISNQWGATPISAFDYTNDELGCRTRRVDSASITNDFSYNAKSELTSADMGTNTYGYTYDPIGNRRTVTNNAEVLTYLVNELNQYTNIADGVTNAPTYDADGNMLTHGGWTFGWNGENRLINASNSTHEISYSYDYMGRRFRKVVDDGSSVVTNTFLYDGWNLIAETDGSSTNHYVWGLDLSGTMQGAGGIGGLLATVQDVADPGSSGGEAYFSCFDANGNLTDYVDEDGSNVAHYVYGPFGQTIASTGDKVDDFRFRFSTKYEDSETGLLYYGYRYYSPELGRWPSRDPMLELGFFATIRVDDDITGFEWGLHDYGFCDNTPLMKFDYLGGSIFCYCTYGPPVIGRILPGHSCGLGKFTYSDIVSLCQPTWIKCLCKNETCKYRNHYKCVMTPKGPRWQVHSYQKIHGCKKP